MKFKDFCNDFTKRWSTALVAIYGLVAFIVGFYYPVLYLTKINIKDIFHLNFIKELFCMHFQFSFTMAGIITAITLLSLYTYCLFTKIKNKLFGKIFLISSFLVLFLLPIPFLFKIIEEFDMRGLVSLLTWSLGSIFTFLFFTIPYFILLIIENRKNIRIENVQIVNNKYYKNFSMLFYTYTCIGFVATLIIIIFDI